MFVDLHVIPSNEIVLPPVRIEEILTIGADRLLSSFVFRICKDHDQFYEFNIGIYWKKLITQKHHNYYIFYFLRSHQPAATAISEHRRSLETVPWSVQFQ